MQPAIVAAQKLYSLALLRPLRLGARQLTTDRFAQLREYLASSGIAH